jgi:predicted MPP superfamily phosphohydrolase
MKITRRGFIRLGLLAGLAVTGGVGFINARGPVLNRTRIPLRRLPPALDGLKVGLISDIHAGPLNPPSLIRRGVDLILDAQPDLVVLAGDFVSGATRFLWTTYGGFREKDLATLTLELQRLTSKRPTYGVLGNHDFWTGPEVARRIDEGLRAAGVRVLRNESLVWERGGGRIMIAGVDDYWEDSCDPRRALKDQTADLPVLLLSHNPDINEEIMANDRVVDLVLSGHTHGGQVVLPLIGAPFLPSSFGQKYRAGLVADGDRRTFVSQGLGCFFVPVRLGAPSEVNLLTLTRG